MDRFNQNPPLSPIYSHNSSLSVYISFPQLKLLLPYIYLFARNSKGRTPSPPLSRCSPALVNITNPLLLAISISSSSSFPYSSFFYFYLSSFSHILLLLLPKSSSSSSYSSLLPSSSSSFNFLPNSYFLKTWVRKNVDIWNLPLFVFETCFDLCIKYVIHEALSFLTLHIHSMLVIG